MLRKIIFIGQMSDSTIYLNTKTNQILKRESSALLDMEGSRNNGRYAAIGSIGCAPFLGLTAVILQQIFGTGNRTYTRGVLLCLTFIWLFEIVGLVLLLERALYGKKSVPLVPASSSEFGRAYRSNIIFNNPKGKKVTLANKVGTLVFQLLMVFVALVVCAFMILTFGVIFSTGIAGVLPDDFQMLNKPLEFKLLLPVLTLGVMPFIGYLFLFQNNPFRWLLAVEKYKKRKLKSVRKKASADE